MRTVQTTGRPIPERRRQASRRHANRLVLVGQAEWPFEARASRCALRVRHERPPSAIQRRSPWPSGGPYTEFACARRSSEGTCWALRIVRTLPQVVLSIGTVQTPGATRQLSSSGLEAHFSYRPACPVSPWWGLIGCFFGSPGRSSRQAWASRAKGGTYAELPPRIRSPPTNTAPATSNRGRFQTRRDWAFAGCATGRTSSAPC